MERTVGRVKSVAERRATVVIAAVPPCRRCQEGRGCGAGLFGAGRGPVELDIDVPLSHNIKPGDDIVLVLASAGLLEGALAAYGIPLAGLVTGALAASPVAGAGDGAALLGAIVGLGSGLFVSRGLLRRRGTCSRLVPEWDDGVWSSR